MENIALITILAILGVIALVLFLIAYRQHKEKGFIFTNAWLYASQNERDNMDERIKRYEYRVGRNVFFGCGVLFSIMAIIPLSVLLESSWLRLLSFILMGFIVVLLCVYGITQYVTGERLRKSIDKDD